MAYLDLTAEEKAITTLPMNYTYGLSILNSHLDVGATVLLTEKGIAQREFWTFFKQEGATSFGGVPYTYEMLDRMRFTRMELADAAHHDAGGRQAAAGASPEICGVVPGYGAEVHRYVRAVRGDGPHGVPAVGQEPGQGGRDGGLPSREAGLS